MKNSKASLWGTFSGSARATLAVIATATILVACGGGGGGSTGGVTPPVTPPVTTCTNGAPNFPTCTPKPTLTFVTKAPADGTIVPVTATSTVVYSYTDATSVTQNFAMTCGNVTVPTLTVPTMDAVKKQVTFAVSWTGAPSGATCTLGATSIVATGDGGSSLPASVSTQLTIEPLVRTCTAPEVWNVGVKACVYPMGVKVTEAQLNQLPAGCTNIYAVRSSYDSGFSQCWKDFVAQDKVKWVLTSQKMTGTTRADRPIIFASFITPTGRPQTTTMLADTGDLMNVGDEIDGQTHSFGLNFLIGNTEGYIMQSKAPSNCYQWRWNPPTGGPGGANVWDYGVVSCPAN